jgi:hypothetical protein
MHSLTQLPGRAFDLLIGRSANNRALMKSRGQLAPLIVPTPQQKADGLWKESVYLAADAITMVVIDLLVEAGAPRAAISFAMTNLQLEIVKRLSDVDDGAPVQIVFAQSARRWAVLSREKLADAIKDVADHFRDDDLDVKVACFSAPLHQAAAIVRQRAARHDIGLPNRFWLTPEELDACADLLAAAIAPRTSPVIEQWQALRQRETQTVAVS